MPEGRSLPWFRVDVDLVDHPKVLALATAWGVSEAEAGWAIIRLWAWTMRYAARGRLADGAETARAVSAPGARTALERACGIRPKRGDVVSGLVAAGWLDELAGGGWEVHDWDSHNGAAVAKAEKDAERKRTARRRRGDGAETARAVSAPGARTARVTERNGTERNVVEDAPMSGAPSKPRRVKTQKPTDPRHTPLVAELVAAFTELRGVSYPFGGRDAKAVASLLATGHEPEAIVAAWRRALAHRGYPSVAILSELVTHLAHFLGDVPQGNGPVESADWTNQPTGEMDF